MSFARKPPRETRQSTYRPNMEPARAVMRRVDEPMAEPVRKPHHVKTPQRVQQSIRDSARGEECTVHLPGCPFDREKTIWSHAPFGAAGKGMGLKALDVCGAYACTHCDAIVDGQAPRPAGMTREQVLVEWLFGHLKSLVILRQKGLA